MPNFVKTTLILALCFGLSGCLKTRTQLREDGDDVDAASAGAPTEIKDHRPSGGYVIDELKSEFIQLTGRVDELERQGRAKDSTTSQSASAEDVKKLEARVAELEKSQAALSETLGRLVAVQQQQQKSAGSGSGGSVTGNGVDIGLIERARKHYAASEFPQAVDAASAYINSGSGTKSKIEEAFFIRADSYFRQKEYKKAIVDFSRFPEKFQKSKLLPPALLKIALSFESLGMKDDAKGFYQELTDKFPKTPEAKQAKAKLK